MYTQQPLQGEGTGFIEPMSDFWEWYARSQQEAKQHDVPTSELDWLTIQILEIDKLALRLREINLEAKADRIELLAQLWQQRIYQRIPCQYLVGKVTWRDLELIVTPAVLIPRPETEAIADIVAAYRDIPKYSEGTWVDLGTGSGAIALSLAQTFPKAKIHAVDCSPEALAIAKTNAIHCHLSDRITFHLGKWFEPFYGNEDSRNIIGMVSNPPYIPSLEVDRLQPEVRDREPRLALDGGSDGLEAIRHLVASAPNYLASGGYWLVELMAGQAKAVRSLLIANGHYTQIQTHLDYAGIERFVSAQINDSIRLRR
ncbi:peptide chain release factor N(5)-glutamine methyltransferase [Tumidithrix elongata RA019]|uniref:Release factor glutamine methyltransferase n=2 Tax=Tumidithrix TaxID=3088355 RepID=A0AAW9Q1Y1_9CYAN|nr:peptide chain release factor N(5)-glutamine methyltransferase [Tumidithrix elongata RA019]